MKNHLEKLHSALGKKNLPALREEITHLQNSISQQINKKDSALLQSELPQILDARTMDRARYYTRRLIKGLTEVKTGKLNDLNLNRWKEYGDIITDSLWLLDKRDRSGYHSSNYWGNFIPQIPNQLLRRYTKKKDWVLDPFLGSGTTLIECKRLGRNGIGVELNPAVLKNTRKAIYSEQNHNNAKHVAICGNSTRLNFSAELKTLGIKSVQFALVHPPYWDIIKFSKRSGDLSNAKSLQDFIEGFGKVVENCALVLDAERYLAVVIGDKYGEKELVPLGFLSMQEVLKHGFKLKSIIVKNFNQTKAKRNQQELWRYRAFVGGFYVFKHEYIFLFQKI
jgi:DNA modification methylase